MVCVAWLRGLVAWRSQQLVGMFLPPVQTAAAAVDANAQIVFIAGGDLAGPDNSSCTRCIFRPSRAALESQHHLRVVVQPAPVHKAAQPGSQLAYFHASDEFGQLIGMAADVTNAAACACAREVGAPVGLPLAADFQRPAEPVLRVLNLHPADVAQLPLLHHLARMAASFCNRLASATELAKGLSQMT